MLAVAPSVPMPLTLGSVGGISRRRFAGNSGLRAIGGTILTAVPAPIMALRPPLVGTATGPPDLYKFGLGGRCGSGCLCGRRIGDGCARGCSFTGNAFRLRLDLRGLRRSLRCCLDCRLSSALRFWLGFWLGFWPGFDGNRLAWACHGHVRFGRECDFGQQRRRRYRHLFAG
jgi:hypothetical protein